MTEREREERQNTPAKTARAERLAAELKANLKRRKAQARGREEAGAELDKSPDRSDKPS